MRNRTKKVLCGIIAGILLLHPIGTPGEEYEPAAEINAEEGILAEGEITDQISEAQEVQEEYETGSLADADMLIEDTADEDMLMEDGILSVEPEETGDELFAAAETDVNPRSDKFADAWRSAPLLAEGKKIKITYSECSGSVYRKIIPSKTAKYLLFMGDNTGADMWGSLLDQKGETIGAFTRQTLISQMRSGHIR